MYRRSFASVLLVLSCAALALAPPLALGDASTKGIPDVTCQTWFTWHIHDYVGAGDAARPIVLDGNTQGCGVTYGHFLLSASDCEDLASSGVPIEVYLLACETDRPVADFDNDREFGIGGAILVSSTYPRTSPWGDAVGAGGYECHGIVGHHHAQMTIRVEDVVLPTVLFRVFSDWTQPGLAVPGRPECGDGIVQPCADPSSTPPSTLPQPANFVEDSVRGALFSVLNTPGYTCDRNDQAMDCIDACIPWFGPGADGAYWVMVSPDNPYGTTGVQATAGHITLF